MKAIEISCEPRVRSTVSPRTIALILAATLCAAPTTAAEQIAVPGGTQALVNILGHLDQSPEQFFSSLNRSLLSTADERHDWKGSEKRQTLVQYLEDVERLRKVFPNRLTVGTASKPAKKAFVQLAAELGFKAKLKKGSFDLQPLEGEDKDRRRRLGAALGIDLHRLARDLGDETAEVEFASGQIDLPLSLAQWSAITDRDASKIEPLEALAKDQRLGLILEGKRRLAEGVLAAVDAEFLSWAYDRAPSTLYRYASTLETRDQQLLLPGGDDAVALWGDLVGVSPRDSSQFIRELLTRSDGRAAYLWHAMHFADEATAAYYLGTSASSLGDDRRYVKKLYSKLDNSASEPFDSRYGGDLGFSVLVRSVPVAVDGSGLDLPGGTGVWFQAIKGDQPPRNHSDLAREVAKGQERELDYDEFLLKALTEQTDMGQLKLPVLPRLIRTANLFDEEHRALLTPANVILLSRASDHFPAALDLLDTLEFEDPSVIEDYLLAVGHLANVPNPADRELLVTNFQGGAEWLRGLARAGKVSAKQLEAWLAQWSRLHSRSASPEAAASRQLEWIVSVLRALPAVTDATPGRGPFERAMIDALAPALNQVFQWKDLEYEGARGDDLIAAMARNLEAQFIPSADSLVEIHDAITDLRKALEAEDLDATRLGATSLRDSTRSLPVPSFAGAIKEKSLLRRVTTTDREEIREILDQLLQVKKAKKLSRQVEDLDTLEELLAGELRPFLLAPAYLVAMGDQSNPLLEDSGLIHKHLLIRYRTGGEDRDASWETSSVSQNEVEELGTFVRGSLSTVARALSDFNLGSTNSDSAAANFNLGRARLWYADLIATPWHEYSAEQTHLIATLRALGEAVAKRIIEDVPETSTELDALVRRVVPTARLETAGAGSSIRGIVSPSEMLAIGLEALERGLTSDEERAILDEATLRVGADWRRLLDRFGTATKHLNGKTRPWVGTWPSYEAVEREKRPTALNERELLDLRVALFDYLGRQQLAGALGGDLMRKSLEVSIRDLRLESDHDWESWVRWAGQMDSDFFDARMRECLKDGLYRLRSF